MAGFKTLIIVQNLTSEGGSFDRPNERIIKILSSKNNETIYEFGTTKTTFLFDFGGDCYGYNKLRGESI